MSEKEQILKRAFGRHWTSSEEILFQCPKCNHDKLKLSVNIEKNAFKCWVCGFSGNKISYLINRYAPDYRAEWIDIAEELDLSQYEFIFQESSSEIAIPISLPKEFKTLTGPKTGDKSRALNYLYSRDITDADILRWKVGFCDYGDYEGRIIIPSFDSKGELNYFIARSYVGDWMKYKNPPNSKNIIFNDINIDWGDDVVIVEGAFDAIRHKNCIPVLGSLMTEKNKLFQKICRKKTEVFLALDADAKDKEVLISRLFQEYGVSCRTISLGNNSDLGDMSRIQFAESKQKADFITDLDYLKHKFDF